MCFEDDIEHKPSSIIITTLAAKQYQSACLFNNDFLYIRAACGRASDIIERRVYFFASRASRRVLVFPPRGSFVTGAVLSFSSSL